AALRHAERDLALPPQMPFLSSCETNSRLYAPTFELRNLSLHQRLGREPGPPLNGFPNRLLQVAIAFQRNQSPRRAARQVLISSRASPLRSQRNQQQGLVNAVEFQQLNVGAEYLRDSMRPDRPAPFHLKGPSRGHRGTRLPADDEGRSPQTERHEEKSVAAAASSVDNMRI